MEGQQQKPRSFTRVNALCTTAKATIQQRARANEQRATVRAATRKKDVHMVTTVGAHMAPEVKRYFSPSVAMHKCTCVTHYDCRRRGTLTNLANRSIVLFLSSYLYCSVVALTPAATLVVFRRPSTTHKVSHKNRFFPRVDVRSTVWLTILWARKYRHAQRSMQFTSSTVSSGLLNEGQHLLTHSSRMAFIIASMRYDSCLMARFIAISIMSTESNRMVYL